MNDSMTQTFSPGKHILRFLSSAFMGTVISLLLLVTISILAFFWGALSHTPIELGVGSLLLFKVDVTEGQLGVVMGVGLLLVALIMGFLNAFVREVFLSRRH